MCRKAYTTLFTFVGVELGEEDGCSLDVIEAAEHRLGVEIPDALKGYYLVAGREPRLNQFYNRFLPPEKWEIDDKYLIFLEENQKCAYWGIVAELNPDPDPIVYIGVNRREEGLEWAPTNPSCFQFMKAMFVWQASFGGGATACAVGYGDEHAMRHMLEEHCQFMTDGGGMTAYHHPFGLLAFVNRESRINTLMKLAPWHVYAAAGSAEDLERIKASFDLKWDEWSSV